jgi:hypothetical protein
VASQIFLAVVGTGKCEKYPGHKIVFWEANKDTGSSEINFKSNVLAISSLENM